MKIFRFIIFVILISFMLVCDTTSPDIARNDTGDCWVYDAAVDCLLKISSDDGSILSRTYGFNDPVGMEIDPTTGELWLLDRGDKVLIRVREDGTIRKKFYGFSDPTHMKVMPDTGEVWVVDDDRLKKLSTDGEVLKDLGGFTDVRDIDIAYTFHDNLWVAEPQRVTYLSEDGEILLTYEGSQDYPLEDVINIEAERDSEACWIADRHISQEYQDHIILIEYGTEGEIRRDYAEDFDGIITMEYNFADFSLWVIFEEDFKASGNPSTLVKMDIAGEPVFNITPFDEPISLSVDTLASRLFVWIGDKGSGRVYQIYDFGTTNHTIKGIAKPELLAIVNKNY